MALGDPSIVYKITNKVNNKAYIGYTTRTMKRRWVEHLCASKNGRMAISRAIKKYGSENFVIELIGSYDDEQSALIAEVYFISLFKTNKPRYGYNSTNGGEGATGFRLNKEQKEKVSLNSKLKWTSIEFRAKIIANSKRMWDDPNFLENQKIKQNSKKWLVTHPNGREEIVLGLDNFCKNVGIKPCHMRDIAHNKGRSQHKGYRCKLI